MTCMDAPSEMSVAMDQDRYKFSQLKPGIDVFHILPDAIKINDMIVLDYKLS